MQLRVNGQAIPSGTIIKLAGDYTTHVTTSTRGIQIDQADRPTYEDQYASYIAQKSVAMIRGGTGVNTDGTVIYTFAQALYGSYFEPGGHPYLKTFQQMSPDAEGNIVLLPGEVVDVRALPDPSSPTIAVSRLKGICSHCADYIEIHAFIWRLYHALNYQIRRLHKFDAAAQKEPGVGRVLGTLPSYQATVARWNHYVWLTSFLFRLESTRETASFSVGYTSTACTLSGLNIHATLTLDEGYVPPEVEVTSARFLTLYFQSTVNNLRGSQVGITTTLSKTVEGAEVNIGGSGIDEDTEKPWSQMDINIAITGSPAFKQQDNYSILFALAPAQGVLNNIYTQQTQGEGAKHKMTLTITWSVAGQVFTQTKSLEVSALLEHAEEEEED